MSYLMDFRTMPPRRDGARRVHVRWRSVTGSLLLAHPDVSPSADGAGAWRLYYRRYSRLGERLAADAESEQHYIRKELHKHNLVPSGRAVEFIGLRD